MTIKQIITKYRRSIGLILFFVLIENIAWIIEPTFFGKLLDALIDRFYDHVKNNNEFKFISLGIGVKGGNILPGR